MSKSKYIELYIVVCFSLPVHNHDLIMNHGMVYLFKCQAIVFFFGKQLDEQISIQRVLECIESSKYAFSSYIVLDAMLHVTVIPTIV